MRLAVDLPYCNSDQTAWKDLREVLLMFSSLDERLLLEPLKQRGIQFQQMRNRKISYKGTKLYELINNVCYVVNSALC